MEWKQIRAQYEREFTAAKRRGATQASVAKAGGLKGQNVISKVLMNDTLGPQVETFVKAVQGLGIHVSVFFAHIERLQNSSLPATQADNPDPLEQAIQHAGVPLSAADEETWTKIGRAIGRGLREVRYAKLAQPREQTPNPRARKPGRGTRHRKDR